MGAPIVTLVLRAFPLPLFPVFSVVGDDGDDDDDDGEEAIGVVGADAGFAGGGGVEGRAVENDADLPKVVVVGVEANAIDDSEEEDTDVEAVA